MAFEVWAEHRNGYSFLCNRTRCPNEAAKYARQVVRAVLVHGAPYELIALVILAVPSNGRAFPLRCDAI